VMDIRKQKIDAAQIVRSTHSAKKRIEKTIELANKFVFDPDRQTRLEKSECPVCYYIDSRVGGAMMTTVQCALCDEIMCFPSTSTDILCLGCAKHTKLCKHCGADVDVKNRRKFGFLTKDKE